MAPSQSQIVTLVAGSSLIIGVLFTIYLIRRKKDSHKDDTGTSLGVNENANNSSKNAVEETDASENVFPSPFDDSGPPVPDKDGLTVSASWAILSPDSDSGSPHLSPVNSQESLLDGILEQSESTIADDSQGLMALDVSTSESTILVDKVPAAMSEPVIVEEMVSEYEQTLNRYRSTVGQTFTGPEASRALVLVQCPEQGIKPHTAEVLVALLAHESAPMALAALNGIANSATFTNNQNTLREVGCLPRLAGFLELQRMALRVGRSYELAPIKATILAVTNLAVNEQNNSSMEACVPTLVDIALDKETGEAVCMSSLQALTNLSVTPVHHGQYTRLVERLYELLQTEQAATRLQTLKILINLSCNPDMVPHMLAAKAPQGLLDFLQPSITGEDVILRFITLLANVLNVVKEQNITSSSLPPDDKAASPETMYTALLGIGNVGNLKNKVFLLCKHSNEEVKQHAISVYNHLK